nr:MAG: hypothetical protein [Bacteriophage sp.]
MIIDKHKPIRPSAPKEIPVVPDHESDEVQEVVETNAMVEAYKAVRKILESIPKDSKDPNSPPLFKTIKLDNGQLNRIKYNGNNQEYGIVFPAVFIHFINIYYNVGTSNIADGKGTMRIHYVLNRLNNSDDEVECEGLEVYKRIVAAIESKKSDFPALVYRFQLEYWDQPLTFDDALQPYWIDYQIWFQDFTSYAYKDYKDVYVTVPPFTQPSDQNEIANPDHIPNHEYPKFEDVAGFWRKKQ